MNKKLLTPLILAILFLGIIGFVSAQCGVDFQITSVNIQPVLNPVANEQGQSYSIKPGEINVGDSIIVTANYNVVTNCTSQNSLWKPGNMSVTFNKGITPLSDFFSTSGSNGQFSRFFKVEGEGTYTASISFVGKDGIYDAGETNLENNKKDVTFEVVSSDNQAIINPSPACSPFLQPGMTGIVLYNPDASVREVINNTCAYSSGGVWGFREYSCNPDGSSTYTTKECPEGCTEKSCSYCKVDSCITPTILSPEENQTPVQIPQETETSIYVCQGCGLDNKCYPFGYRKTDNFCSDSGNFTLQLGSDASCENNFECQSNVCVSGKCISEGFIQSIINWFKKLFGIS